jgi:hypothetical protein
MNACCFYCHVICHNLNALIEAEGGADKYTDRGATRQWW